MCPQATLPGPGTTEKTLEGIPECVPTDEISQSAYKHAVAQLHPLILAHSIRVYLLATELSKNESALWHQGVRVPVLFTACIFHDIGTSSTYSHRPLRFEIEGADAAHTFLGRHSIPLEDRDEVWRAIALHDTPQVAERFPGSGLVRLVRLAVMADFKRVEALELFAAETVTRVEARFPRGDIEKVLGDAVVDQALACPEKAPPACWPGVMLQAKLADPEWAGVNKAF